MGRGCSYFIYLINRVPSSVISGISPFERLYKSVPKYFELRIFGSTCFVHLPKIEQNKLNKKSAICVFLGYGINQKVIDVMILLQIGFVFPEI